MAAITKTSVVKLEDSHPVGRSLWRDAWSRLIRNRAAMLGLFIIVVNIVIAIFASSLAPQHYADQELADNNGAPMWIINMFPAMTPREESYRIGRGWSAAVETGMVLSAGDTILEKGEGESYETTTAPMEGTIFQDGSSLVLYPFDYQRAVIRDGLQPTVEEGEVVTAGTILLAAPNTSDQIIATIDGTVYLTEEAVLVRPDKAGYVPVRSQYPLGADGLGRDLLSRIIYGARISLLVAFVGPLVSFLIGVPYGLTAGYFGGRVDNIMMRFVDTMYAFPTLLLIILLMAFFRSSFGGGASEAGTFSAKLSELDRATGGMLFIFVGIGMTSWMGLARLTRGQVLSVREHEFVVAANSIGVRTPQILWRHILPNVLGPIIVTETLTIPVYIRYEAFLSFIGLGVNPPTPSWGSMISEGSAVIRSYPYQALFPAIALFMIMFAFNFLGDGLRDALDPRMRGVD